MRPISPAIRNLRSRLLRSVYSIYYRFLIKKAYSPAPPNFRLLTKLMPALTACNFFNSRGLPLNTDDEPLLRGDAPVADADLLPTPAGALTKLPPQLSPSVLLGGNVNTGDAPRRGVVVALADCILDGPGAESPPSVRRSQETAAREREWPGLLLLGGG